MTGARVGKRAVVHGVVQGVGFRYGAQVVARTLGVGGYAENLADGTVRVEAVGDAASIEQFVAWLREGPPGAQVDSVDVTDIEPEDFAGFRAR
jgi:acylphosphatase